MRLIIIILLFSLNASATNYYISNTGSDAANGLTIGTAWRTIAKINASTFLAGDSILFKKGDSWNERLNPPSSGSVGNPIIFGSYGSGVKPLITGFQSLSMSNTGGNIWTATATNSVAKLNAVLLNGRIAIKARYPNNQYLTFTALTSNTVTGTLTGTPNYTGGEAVVRNSWWVTDVKKITSQVGGVLTLQNNLTYSSANGTNQYFIQNLPSLVDTLNEYSYDSTSKVLTVFSTTTPSVQYSNLDTLVYLSNKNYINFEGISFTGGNVIGMRLESTNYIKITDCVFSNIGAVGIDLLLTNNCTIKRDSVNNCLSGGIYSDPDTYLTIDSNIVKNIGIYAGMGQNGNGKYIGIYTHGLRVPTLSGYVTITNNRIDSCGYNGMSFVGIKSLVQNNVVNTYCFIKDDGAGIYTFTGNGNLNYDTGSIIRKNIVLNGIGAPRNGDVFVLAHGIYLDDGTKGVTVDSNTVANIATSGIQLHTVGGDIKVNGNTVLLSRGNALQIDTYFIWGGFNLFDNILMNTGLDGYLYRSSYNNPSTTINYNYYFKPSSPTNSLSTLSVLSQLPEWTALTGHDANSFTMPSGIASNVPTLIYNPTAVDSTVSVAGSFIDAKSNQVFNTVTLAPFTSRILFQSSTSFAPIPGRRIIAGRVFQQQ